MKRIKCLLVVSTVFFLCIFTIMAQTKKDIIVKVTNIPTKTGRVLVATEDQKYYGMAEVTGSQTEVKLSNLPNGKYKLNVFHDTNDNWQLDKEDGIPTEYCAMQSIEVTDSTRSFSVVLVNVKEMVENSSKQQ